MLRYCILHSFVLSFHYSQVFKTLLSIFDVFSKIFSTLYGGEKKDLDIINVLFWGFTSVATAKVIDTGPTD